MSFNAKALDVDFQEYLKQLAKLACVALEFTGPMELSYSVDEGCKIVVSIKKDKAD